MLAGCFSSSLSGFRGSGSSEPLKIVAATELEDLQPSLEQAFGDVRFPIELSSAAGVPLATSQALKSGEFD